MENRRHTIAVRLTEVEARAVNEAAAAASASVSDLVRAILLPRVLLSLTPAAEPSPQFEVKP